MEFTFKKFPNNNFVKGGSGLPWGGTLRPLKELPPAPSSLGDSEKWRVGVVPQCEGCKGYMNPHVALTRDAWICCLCSRRNPLPVKYQKEDERALYPELNLDLVEYTLVEKKDTDIKNSERGVYVAVIDATGNQTFNDSVREGLLSAIDELPECSLFGMLTFSDNLGVLNLLSSYPTITHLPLSSHNPSQFSVPIDSALPIGQFLVPLQLHKEHIKQSIQRIGCSGQYSLHTGRAFGCTLNSLVDCLKSYEDIRNVRILGFISDIPNVGVGAIPPHKVTKNKENELSPSTLFYKELAQKCCECNICIDVFAIKQEDCENIGLASMRHLSTMTGGYLRLYDESNLQTLAKDVKNQLSCEQGYNAIIKIRTSSGFSVKEVFGPVIPVNTKSNNIFGIEPSSSTFTVVALDNQTILSLDFQHDDFNGFSKSKVYIQVVVGYSKLYKNSGTRNKIRVFTYAIPVVSTIEGIYSSADPAMVIYLLTQKIMKSRFEHGIDEAKSLVEDWFAVLLMNYNKLVNYKTGTKNFDATFSDYKNLFDLPYLVFGLLNNDILARNEYTDFPDYWHFLYSFYSSLSPFQLQCCLYPFCLGFKTEFDEEPTSIQLSMSSITNNTFNILVFCLLQYHKIILYYPNPHQHTHQQFPRCKLVDILNSLQSNCSITPTLSTYNTLPQDLLPQILLNDSEDLSYSTFILNSQSLVEKLSK